jgi:ketosteroid isomerase-like protein
VETTAAARRWAEVWREAWAALDPEPIVALYAGDALFLSQPFREPESAAEYVRRELAEEQWAEPWFGEPLVDGDRAAVEWHAFVREDGLDVTLAGVSLLRFDAAGLCVEQRDTFAVVEGRVPLREPPA